MNQLFSRQNMRYVCVIQHVYNIKRKRFLGLMIILQGYNHFFLMDDGKPPVKVDGYPERVIHVGTLLGKGFEPKVPLTQFQI